MDNESDRIRMTELTRVEARLICTWEYESPYDVYNLPPWETLCAQGWDMASQLYLSTQYKGFWQDDVFVAYGRVFAVGQFAFISIGLKPDWCGKGNGIKVLNRLVEEAARIHPDRTVSLEVRCFNLRAIRCYEKAGFRIVKQYRRKTTIDEDDFYLMVRQGMDC